MCFFVKPIHSLDPVRFGPEFTFMQDPTLIHGGDLSDQMRKHLIENQPIGAKFTLDQGYRDRLRLISPNGWWAAVDNDSGGFEVNVNPMTPTEYKQYAEDLQDAIFVSAANIGHFPALWQGGGHINIDLGSFQGNLLLFRNFLVDILNHNELYMGIFNYDFRNARPPQVGYTSLYNLLVKKGFNTQWGFDDYVKHVLVKIDRVMSDVDPNLEDVAEEASSIFGSIGRAFSLAKRNASRLEFRAVRPQASMDVFIRQIELLEGRLRYLENFTSPIPYQAKVPLKPDAQEAIHSTYAYTPPVDPQQALRAFYEYVTESGQRWRNHRDYLWPQWIADGELERFESSAWFKSHENICIRLLQRFVRPPVKQ
jgi:hypothetical protein